MSIREPKPKLIQPVFTITFGVIVSLVIIYQESLISILKIALNRC